MIRIYKNKLFLSVVAVLLFFSSCKKSFLEKLPPTALPPEVALATEADLQVALRGAYASLRATDYFGRTVPVIGDLMADNGYVHPVNTGRYTQFNTYTFVLMMEILLVSGGVLILQFFVLTILLIPPLQPIQTLTRSKEKLMPSGHYVIFTWSVILPDPILMIQMH